MSLYVIADLHLATGHEDKSMEVFGRRWIDYIAKIKKNWLHLIGDGDTVVIPGDISWALTLEESLSDLKFIDALPGKKILLKGNHDFWWSTAAKMKAFFEKNGISTIELLHNNALIADKYIVCGTRGWFVEGAEKGASAGEADNEKIMRRENLRLKMSLDAAAELARQSGGEKEIIAFFHFPPAWNDFRNEEALDSLASHGIRRAYFGHIHNYYGPVVQNTAQNVALKLISADYLDFIPLLV